MAVVWPNFQPAQPARQATLCGATQWIPTPLDLFLSPRPLLPLQWYFATIISILSLRQAGCFPRIERPLRHCSAPVTPVLRACVLLTVQLLLLGRFRRFHCQRPSFVTMLLILVLMPGQTRFWLFFLPTAELPRSFRRCRTRVACVLLAWQRLARSWL